MIKSYKFVLSPQQILHEFVIAFFNKIEFTTADYSPLLYEKTFYDEIICHHPRVLEDKFKEIYNKVKKWDQVKRSLFCKNIVDSNKIEEICEGVITPTKLEQVDEEIRENVANLFDTLYEKILKKSKYFQIGYGNLLQHFKDFKRSPNDFVKCPACGIRDVETIFDNDRDQYDHYLAKSIYPFSTVNFYNLVPICQKCNSLDVKSNFDIISYNGVAFYPYSTTHKGIKIEISIANDNIEIDKITYNFLYSNEDGNLKQIETWKSAFKIETRYKNFVKGRIAKWFRVYYSFIHDRDLSHLSIADRKLCCFKALEKDESVELSFIRKPALEAFLSQSVLGQAQEEVKLYSLYH